VLGEKRRAHLGAAIVHVDQLLSDANDADLSAPTCALPSSRSRRSATSTTADVRRELRKIHSEAIKPRPRTLASDLQFDLMKLRDKGWIR
jgi:3-oxoacyl-ACP reductase-like protein